MSLYSHEEICEGCIFGIWARGNLFWDHRARFRRCQQKAERMVSHTSCYCPRKMRSEDLKDIEGGESKSQD